MSDIVDLDALVPRPVTIHYGGADIEVKPPKTAEILKLGALGQKIQAGDEHPDELEHLLDEVTEIINRCVPELQGKDLNSQQLLALVTIIGDMSVPPDSKELKKRGITPGDPKA